MAYLERIKKYSAGIETASRKYNRLSTLRLLSFLAGVSGLVFVFYFGISAYGWTLFSAGLLLFIVFVIMHIRIAEKKQYLQRMLSINEQSQKRTEGTWTEFPDTGEEYINPNHPYSRDLDIFGKDSLFQLINVTNTPHGREKLKTTLENPYQSADDTVRRQQAVTELAEKLDWRQRFQAEGMKFSGGQKELSVLNDLAGSEKPFISKKMTYLVRVSPAILMITAAVSMFTNFFPGSVPAVLAIVHLFLIGRYARKTKTVVRKLMSAHDSIKIFRGLIGMIEKEHFASTYLAGLQKELLNDKGISASAGIKRLETLTDIVGMRASFLHFPINIITLLDLQCIISYENWRRENGAYAGKWIDAVAKMETVSSLCLLRYDHPEWCMPDINNKEDSFTVSVKDAAHPLIREHDAIGNDYLSDKKGCISIITGSNMSGKSTFLRTIALNLVLAYAGAPVCAKRMECSRMKIYTSMRITDNLGKHESSFYAELLRIKMIIDESNRKERIFFALDELFRGTNSRDRILGARAVIQNLSSENVTGMISTHDLELTELSKDGSADIVNYHFRETYDNAEILFDYKIYEGVSQTSDAVFLMKKAGIRI